MPLKRRPGKARALHISPAALRRWRQVRPWGIDAVCVVDHELGELVDMPALLAQRPEDLDALREALEAALVEAGMCR